MQKGSGDGDGDGDDDSGSDVGRDPHPRRYSVQSRQVRLPHRPHPLLDHRVLLGTRIYYQMGQYMSSCVEARVCNAPN